MVDVQQSLQPFRTQSLTALAETRAGTNSLRSGLLEGWNGHSGIVQPGFDNLSSMTAIGLPTLSEEPPPASPAKVRLSLNAARC
jgi:hypothetical protein